MKPEKSKSSSSSKKSSKKKDGKGEDDTDSEEERWLDAIESGKLEEVMMPVCCSAWLQSGCEWARHWSFLVWIEIWMYYIELLLVVNENRET